MEGLPGLGLVSFHPIWATCTLTRPRSYEFPMKNYGDLAFRLYGSFFRYVVNILQSVQLLAGVGLIVISNGQALSQVAKFKLCYAVCCLIWALVGFGVGQVRTLQKYGWLANAAVFVNLMIMFISMGKNTF